MILRLIIVKIALNSVRHVVKLLIISNTCSNNNSKYEVVIIFMCILYETLTKIMKILISISVSSIKIQDTQ